MSRTTRPVTQVADDAVNRAFIGFVQFLFLDEIGRVKRIAPTIIINKYERMINLPGSFLILDM